MNVESFSDIIDSLKDKWLKLAKEFWIKDAPKIFIDSKLELIA